MGNYGSILSDLSDVNRILVNGQRVSITAYDKDNKEIKPEVINADESKTSAKIDKLSKLVEFEHGEEYWRLEDSDAISILYITLKNLNSIQDSVKNGNNFDKKYVERAIKNLQKVIDAAEYHAANEGRNR